MCETERQAKMELIEFDRFVEQDDCDKYNMLQQSACEIRALENKNQQLEERIRILTEHPFISSLNNGIAFNKKEISFIIRIDNKKAFKVEKELFDYVTNLEQKNILFKTKMLEKEGKGIKLQKEKQQLKEIIDELREYIKENRLFQFKYNSQYSFLGISEEEPKKDLLQILDKVKNV